MEKYLKAFGILTDLEIQNLSQYARHITMKKGSFFVKEGEVCEEVAFVKSGIFRSYYTSEDGEESTYCITFPENFMTAYSSYITLTPTTENIQAIATAELVVVHKNEIEKLASQSLNWMRFLKIMAEQQYIELEHRIFQLQREKAKQRYINLLNHQPRYVQHIPLQYLASYLGITQRHLSRLRKEITLLDNCPIEAR